MYGTRHMLLALAALPFALGCGSDSTGPSGPVTGTFTLRAVGSTALPAVIQSEPAFDYTLEITAGSIVLRQDWSFTLEIDLRDTEGDQVSEYTDEVSGTYTRSGNSLTLTQGEESIAGTLRGDTLTLLRDGGGEALTFRR